MHSCRRGATSTSWSSPQARSLRMSRRPSPRRFPPSPARARGLELSIVTSASVRTPSDTPPFEPHLNTLGDRVVDGEGGPGDADLVAHFAMAREHGVAILGPPPMDLIAPIDRSRLLRTLADDLAWSVE